MASVYQKNLGLAGKFLPHPFLKRRMNRIPKRSCHFSAGGAGPNDNEVQRALRDNPGIAISSLDDRKDPRPQQLGIVKGVQRVGVLVSSRRAEKVSL